MAVEYNNQSDNLALYAVTYKRNGNLRHVIRLGSNGFDAYARYIRRSEDGAASYTFVSASLLTRLREKPV
jgi:hypothetical protein